ncbi:unnamed protein product [Phyllotreta striolata]|uniref:DNA/RNA non-specific endonuclease/pyrophosphatase/phosphodiesterase domain-containing protein n=1 Tax=Phyllotreta striolata TaxID=444603 RepID=A0A9N9TM89_PHYSR|nr:unnamed protein product [Phyllotreta striolata]
MLLAAGIIASCFVFCHAATQSGCTLTIQRNDAEKYVPVLLNNRSHVYNLTVPEQGEIRLRRGQGITFLCPEKNYLVPTHSNSTYATCLHGTKLSISRTEYDFSEILCHKPIRGEIQKTRESCGNGRGTITNIGYTVTPRYFKTLIKVCYDEARGANLYSQHIIHGEEVAYTSKFRERPGFSTAGLPKGVSANVAYKRAYQKSTFSSLLGSSGLAERYINKKSFLSRGHLAPDADFLFASSQLTSYFYINTCPQWQSINGGNWVKVESSVREAASKYGRRFTIITGTHGVLELPDSSGRPVEVYLVSRRKLPVPKFVWKIIYDDFSGKAIAIVSLNNPFVDSYEDAVLCNDICDRFGWGAKSFGDFSRGLIYCCDVNEFREVVDSVPDIVVNGILRSP